MQLFVFYQDPLEFFRIEVSTLGITTGEFNQDGGYLVHGLLESGIIPLYPIDCQDLRRGLPLLSRSDFQLLGEGKRDGLFPTTLLFPRGLRLFDRLR
jgi:hypothetical protein